MKTIGLIGGMSWPSTITYYRIINEKMNERLGGAHSARIILYSVEFSEIAECQKNGRWDKCAEILGDAAEKLEAAGAGMILICANTMHKSLPYMKEVRLPVLHIAEATAAKLNAGNVKKVGLLGTKYTMLQDFYKEKIENAGIEVLIPEKEAVEEVNRII